MTEALWPPPPAPEDEYAIKRVVFGPAPKMRLRGVPLWGRLVFFDDASGLVWCPRCLRLVSTDELSTIVGATKHPEVGHPGRRWNGEGDLWLNMPGNGEPLVPDTREAGRP